MTDKEKIEKLLEYIENMAERLNDEEPCIAIDDDWCDEHCGDKYCPTAECYKHYLLGE